jgi:hypothetical protein
MIYGMPMKKPHLSSPKGRETHKIMYEIMLFKKYFSIYCIIYCIIKDEKWYADEVSDTTMMTIAVF